ncbi:MAG: AMP-binding protein [Mariniblastus sp.]
MTAEIEIPQPIWCPSNEDIENSNVGRWMKSTGHETYSQFHQWTVEDRNEFWGQAVDRLGIKFLVPPEKILEDKRGVAQAAWLVGAKLNIADSCFTADENAVAIVTQKPGGVIRKQTYGELRKRASRVANGLVDGGYKVGDAIGVLMPMTDWSVAIYLGIVMAGCTVISIADSFAPPEIATRLEIAGAKAVFTYDHQNRAGKQLPLYRKLIEATQLPAIVLSADSIISVDLREQDRDWAEFLVERDSFEPVPCTVNETINVLFSSGTTGDPKAIPWSHLTPIKCAIDGYCHQDIKPGDVVAWPTNLGWMMGPWLIFASLINRAAVALYEDAPMGAGFGEFVQDAEVTMLGVVPTIVKAWQAKGEMEQFDWSAIRVFSSTGESSQADTMTYLSKLAGTKPIIEYCGGTEIGGGYVTSVVVLPNFPAAFNTPAVGLDFVLINSDAEEEVLIESGETSPARVGDEGEVFLLPPSIGLSSRLVNRDHFGTYYGNTPVIEGLGQLRRHGDYFRKIETDSCPIYVAGGRADDTMNLGGIKISSAEIERLLNQIDGVLETAAVADSRSGPTKLIVFVVTSSEIEGGDDELQKAMNVVLKKKLNPLFRVHAIRPIDSMPRTASGKVMRRRLRDEL